jgi:hypothetical protein
VRLSLQANQVNAAAHRPGVMPLYPEEDGQFAYSLKYGSSTPDASSPFWTLSLFKELFGSARYLDLPLYGKGAKADDPDARVLSGIRIEFLDDAGQDMRIRILMPGDAEEEKQESEPQETETATAVAPVAKASAKADPVADESFSAVVRMPATGDEQPIGVLLVLFASAAVALYARARRDAVQPRHAR